jgi:SAM-dependent methyltransferase
MDPPLQPDRDNADLWEARYQAGDTGWDRGASHPSLPGILDRQWLQGDVLVPGCGRGYDVQTIAALGDHCTATGIDIAPSALDDAKQQRRYPNEFYHGFSLFRMAEESEDRFDAIWEHTCFCALHPDQRHQYVESTARLLKPDGHLVGVFYLATQDSGDGPPFKIPFDALRGCLQSAFEILEVLPPDQTYPGREGEEILIRAKKRAAS